MSTPLHLAETAALMCTASIAVCCSYQIKMWPLWQGSQSWGEKLSAADARHSPLWPAYATWQCFTVLPALQIGTCKANFKHVVHVMVCLNCQTVRGCVCHAGRQEMFIAAMMLYAAANACIGATPAAYAADVMPQSVSGFGLGIYRCAGDIGMIHLNLASYSAQAYGCVM